MKLAITNDRVLEVVERPGDLVKFDPQAANIRDAKADAIIDYAKRVKDWPALEAAIDRKLEAVERLTSLEWM